MCWGATHYMRAVHLDADFEVIDELIIDVKKWFVFTFSENSANP